MNPTVSVATVTTRVRTAAVDKLLLARRKKKFDFCLQEFFKIQFQFTDLRAIALPDLIQLFISRTAAAANACKKMHSYYIDLIILSSLLLEFTQQLPQAP